MFSMFTQAIVIDNNINQNFNLLSKKQTIINLSNDHIS